MRSSGGLMEWLVKLIFILMLLPFFVTLAGQIITAVAVAVLPWIIGLAVLIGVVAGVSAGLTMRRSLPRDDRRYMPPPYEPPVRRPRGPRDRDDDR